MTLYNNNSISSSSSSIIIIIITSPRDNYSMTPYNDNNKLFQ